VGKHNSRKYIGNLSFTKVETDGVRFVSRHGFLLKDIKEV
jgi:hypothetical protein